MSHQTNIVRLKAVANALQNLNTKIVFVGGATISLYPELPVLEVRPTDDVDVIIEILNYADRAGLEEKLRTIGFVHDIESGVVCRYRINGIVVDILPTDDESIGFKNIWYPDGFKNSVNFSLDKYIEINILSAPYFLATKIEAFKDRGDNDGRTSSDFEDIVFILENRNSIWNEINNADENIRNYLIHEFQIMLTNPLLFEWIDSHVERSMPPASYQILDAIKKLAI